MNEINRKLVRFQVLRTNVASLVIAIHLMRTKPCN